MSDKPEALDLDRMGEEATASYRGMVRKHAQGEPIDPKKLQPILVLAGRGLDAFRADSERLKQRLAAAAAMEAADSDAIAEEINAAQERLRGLEAEQKSLMEDYARRRAELDEKIAAAQSEVLRKAPGRRAPDGDRGEPTAAGVRRFCPRRRSPRGPPLPVASVPRHRSNLFSEKGGGPVPFHLRGVRVLVSGADQGPAEALHALGCEGMSEEVAAGLLGVSVEEFQEELDRNPEWRQAWN